jgi:hypothetical protein
MNYSEIQNIEIILVVPRMPDEIRKTKKYDELRRHSFGNGPSLSDVDDAHWFPMRDGHEMANKTMLANIDSLTEEQYRRFHRLVVPLVTSDTHYESFSGEEMPPLDWLKLNYPDRVVAVEYERLTRPNF